MVRRVLLKVLLACLLWFAYGSVDGDIHLPTILMVLATTVIISFVDSVLPVRGRG